MHSITDRQTHRQTTGQAPIILRAVVWSAKNPQLYLSTCMCLPSPRVSYNDSIVHWEAVSWQTSYVPGLNFDRFTERLGERKVWWTWNMISLHHNNKSRYSRQVQNCKQQKTRHFPDNDPRDVWQLQTLTNWRHVGNLVKFVFNFPHFTYHCRQFFCTNES